MALHYAKKEIQIGEPIKIESIIGTSFTGKVIDTTQFGPYEAVIPEVEGSAYITGRHEFLIDPEDPLKSGFFQYRGSANDCKVFRRDTIGLVSHLMQL